MELTQVGAMGGRAWVDLTWVGEIGGMGRAHMGGRIKECVRILFAAYFCCEYKNLP